MDTYLIYIDKGGFIFSFLLFLSVITVAIIIYKYLEIYIFNSLDFSKFINFLNDSGKKITSTELKEDFIHLAPRSKKKFITNILNIYESNKTKESIEEEINIIVENEFKKINTLLPSLEVISQVSPLIGLLGTVIGMIDSFNELELGGSLVDPSILAGGIWTALLTTAMGLIVAIPALVSHFFLEKKINSFYDNLNILLKKISIVSTH